MKAKLIAICCLLSAICFSTHAQGTAFTYQGRLNDANGPANGSYDIAFTGYAVAIGGSSGGTITNLAVAVTNGLFTITLDIGSIPSGSPIWLELAVRTNSSGAFTVLSPRQSITPTPYAMFANTASNLVGILPVSKLPSGIVTNGANGVYLFGNFIGDGGSLTNVNASALNGLNRTNFWGLGGNIVRSNVDFIGTLNDAPLDFYVNSFRAFRLDSRANVLGGSRYNQVQYSGIYGDPFSATVAGGGSFGGPNIVSAPFATVGGGAGNIASGDGAVVSGGGDNGSNGGGGNSAEAPASVVSGGFANHATGNYSTIGGGTHNTVSGLYSVIPGGNNNEATSDSSLAAGNRAKANHYGSFVWADGQDADFATSGANQFLIRAAGGVGINTNNPHAALQVNGTVMATNFVGAFNGDGSALTALNASQVTSGALPVAQLPAVVVTNGATGVNLNGAFNGNGAGVTNVNATALNGLNSTNFWQLGGNNVAPGQFIGNTNNQPLELRVNNQGGLRLEATGGTPNVIGGFAGNRVGPGVTGSSISGGGVNSFTNVINENFGTIGGGGGNIIQSGATDATIGGGYINQIQPGSYYATIGGGRQNQVLANDSTVGGGDSNLIQTNASDSVIGGGIGNVIQTNSFGSTIGGGANNTIATNAVGASIGGGQQNGVQNNAANATIGGGLGNQAAASYAFVGGGQSNAVTGTHTFIGGGIGNAVTNTYGVIGGGYYNTAGFQAVVGGGAANTASGNRSAVVGGFGNIASGPNSTAMGSNSVASGYAAIAGGHSTASGDYSFAIGTISTASGPGSMAVGNSVASGVYSTAVGSSYAITDYSTAMGNNCIAAGSSSTAMGFNSTASGPGSIAMGHSTASGYFSTAMGYYSTASGDYSTAIGQSAAIGTNSTAIGNSIASGDYSTAMGKNAQATNTGSLVWADSQGGSFTSTANNQASFRCLGGVLFTSGSGAANQTVVWTPGSASWSFSSDRNLKDRFSKVNQQSVLDKLAQLPIVEWSYKGYAQRHIGPMAQDFHALFPLNENDKSLQDADLHGVALAAIQGLNEKLEVRSQKLEAENAELKTRLEKLEQLLLERK